MTLQVPVHVLQITNDEQMQHLFVRFKVLSPQVLEQLPPLVGHGLETIPAVLVLPVHVHVLYQVAHFHREHRNLNLGRTSVA